MLFVVFFVQYMASFKAFMMEIGAENVLFAFNNLQDIYEYLSVLNVSPDVSDEMRSVLCCANPCATCTAPNEQGYWP